MVNRDGVLSSAPLHLVLCGVRFRLRESLPAWIGDIQERLYSARFTRLSRIRQTQSLGGFELAIDLPDFDHTNPGAAYLFSTEDGSVSIQIHKAGFTVFSRSYLHFTEFAADVSSAVDAILASAKHLEVESIGIRYLDFIQPKNGELLSQYISRGLLPFAPDWSDWSGGVITGTSMNSYKVDEDQLVVKCVGAGHPVVPSDLAMAYVTSFGVVDVSSGAIPTIEPQQGTLDIDAVRVGSVLKAERAEQIENEVRRLHRLANDFFRRVCTDHAFSRWNEEP